MIRAGARKLIEAELAALLAFFSKDKLADGRSRLLRDGHLPEREVLTGIGPVTVKVPRLRDRGLGEDKISFRPSLLPRSLRKAKSVEELLPWLYLRGVSTRAPPCLDQDAFVYEFIDRAFDGTFTKLGVPYVFAAPRGGPLSDMALSKVMRDMQAKAEKAARKAGEDVERAGWRDPRSGKPAVPHGLCSTSRDWAAEKTEWPCDMAEIALAHKVGSEVERAYRRGDMIEKRRAMMADWAKFLGAV